MAKICKRMISENWLLCAIIFHSRTLSINNRNHYNNLLYVLCFIIFQNLFRSNISFNIHQALWEQKKKKPNINNIICLLSYYSVEFKDFHFHQDSLSNWRIPTGEFLASWCQSMTLLRFGLLKNTVF